MPPTTSRLAALLAPTSLLVACTTRVELPVAAPRLDPSQDWAELLGEAASPAGVDYDHIAAHRDRLERYLAWVGEHGEISDGWKESKEDQRIAFLVNAYNAAVIQGVLMHRPIDSVRDVRVGPFPPGGAGFFVGLRFKVDGEWQSLHHLESERIVNRYQEPLVHVALHCASESCPPLRWWPERGLQGHLASAMRRFVGSDRGLAPLPGPTPQDPPAGYAASELFRWYADDFTDWSQADTLCQWLLPYADGAREAWLLAHAEDCPLQFQEWDWSLDHAARVEGRTEEAEEPREPQEEQAAGEDTGKAEE